MFRQTQLTNFFGLLVQECAAHKDYMLLKRIQFGLNELPLSQSLCKKNVKNY